MQLKSTRKGGDSMANILHRFSELRCDRSGPLWKIFVSGTNTSIAWKDHAPNPRFAIYDPKGDSYPENPATLSDDLVVDKETGLVWPREANLLGQRDWLNSNTLCRELELGMRSGWRLPTVEELSSLVDTGQPNLALPPGNPFVNVKYGSGVPAYWSSTNCENPTGVAWIVNFWRGAGPHLAGLQDKSILGFVWPVRGGKAGNNWNW
jgi:hypothetical protein